jgi:hypothetical protein
METVTPATELARRRAIRLARNSVQWRQVVASFALSGIDVTEENEVIAGRMLSGEVTFEQIVAELKEKYLAQV